MEIKNLKTFLNYSFSKKWIQRFETDFLKVITEEVDKIFLDEIELTKAYEYDFKNNSELELARDWLIIGCYTGLRFSDFSRLKKHNFKNISVEKHVPNDQISRLFSRHDVLILPSQQEPWGLVVEEAIAHGLPVIVSDKVGCHSEVVNHKSNGYVFQLKDKNPEENLIEMAKACYWVGGNYIDLINQIRTHPEYHWQKRALKQVEAYF